MKLLGYFNLLVQSKSTLNQYINSTFGVKPSNLKLYELAFTHSSVNTSSNNERLEFIGDAIIDSVVAVYLYENYPKYDEGELTTLRSKIVSRSTLNMLGNDILLESNIKHSIKSINKSNSVIGNTLEAIIGAIYLDKGFETTKKVVIKCLINKLNLDELIETNKNYKSLIQEYCHKKKYEFDYKTSSFKNHLNKLMFSSSLFINTKPFSTGEGSSKKIAEQNAANEGLKKIKSLVD